MRGGESLTDIRSAPLTVHPDHPDLPSLAPREEPDFITCPFCTMQMPTEARNCPHCLSLNPTFRDFREMLVVPERFPRIKAFLRGYWQPLALGSVIALAFLVTAVVYYGWLGHRVVVVPNPVFEVTASHFVENGKVVLEGSVTNKGEDIPDLSLKSIRMIATFGLKGGGTRVEYMFPRSQHRGEGALLNGETGIFRFEVAESQVEDATLAAEVIDLTCGQPSEKCVVLPVERELVLPK